MRVGFNNYTLTRPGSSRKGLSPRHKKQLEALKTNVCWLVRNHGEKGIVFLTFTMAKRQASSQEAVNAWRKMMRKLRPKLRFYVGVRAFQEDGTPHFHALAILKNNSIDGAKGLRSLVKTNCCSFGFGHQCKVEFVARDISKICGYLLKNLKEAYLLATRIAKKCRQIFYSAGWKVMTTHFSFVDSGRNWRNKLARFASIIDCTSLGQLNTKMRYWYRRFGQRLWDAQSDQEIVRLGLEAKG